MEISMPLPVDQSKKDTTELNLSNSVSKKPRRYSKIKSFKDDMFDEKDADLIDLDLENPFSKIFDDPHSKKMKYKDKFPKDDSLTDTNMDSTDTEPTDTDCTTSSLTLYKTTTDTEQTKHGGEHKEESSSPSYHASEDDTDESTDTEYFDSDATTESSEKSYTSNSENVDDSPESSDENYDLDPSVPPDEGPPKTFKWPDLEQMKIPVKETGAKNVIDPFEEDKKRAREKFGPDWVASMKPIWIEKVDIRKNGVSNVIASIVKHLAPRNSVNLEETDLLDRFYEPRKISNDSVFREKYRFCNSILK